MRGVIRYSVCVFCWLLLWGPAGAQRYEVGDVYYGESGQKEGVVFWVNTEGTGGWIVALDNLDRLYNWGPSGAEVPYASYPSALEAMQDLDGYANTQKLRDLWGEGTEYAAQAVDFEKGWYLPAAGQLRRLASLHRLLDSVLLENGGTPLLIKEGSRTSYYWSSSVNDAYSAFALRLQKYYVGTSKVDKKMGSSYVYYTRPIRNFVMQPESDLTYTYRWNTGSSDPVLTTMLHPGKNDYSVVVTSPHGGCTAEARQTIWVAAAGYINYRDTICQGQVYRKNGFDTYVSDVRVWTLEEGCLVPLRLELTVADTFRFPVFDRFCRGDVYSKDGFTAYQPGVYEQRFISRDGCDSVIVLTLEENTSFDTTYYETICRGENYEGHGFRFLSVEKDTFCFRNTPIAGCDSIVRLLLTVRSPAYSVFYDSVCSGKPYSGCEHFSLPRVMQDTICEYKTISASGCDSVVYLHLNVKELPAKYVNDRMCEGEVYTKYGLYLTEGGEREVMLPALSGCDTLLYLSLDVLPVKDTLFQDSACRGSTYAGKEHFFWSEVTKDTVLEYRTSAVTGCDSLVSLHLKALPVPVLYKTDWICEGEVYTGYGLYETQACERELSIPGVTGCDTLLHLSLKVHPLKDTALYDSVCAGEIYNGFEGFAFAGITRDTTARIVLPAKEGCDSTVILSLKCLPLPVKNVEAYIGQGEYYTDYGLHVAEEDTYSVRWPAVTGCDTSVRIQLHVLPDYEQRIDTAICEGQRYAGYGWDLDHTQRDTLQISVNGGPDTLIYLNLWVNPTYEQDVEDRFCEGDIYTKYGLQVTEGGVYPVLLTTLAGCDSLIRLHLNRYPVYRAVIDTAICQGDVFEKYGIRDSMPGIKEVKLRSQEGCDSLLEIHLKVHPTYLFPEKRFLCEGDSCSFYGNTYRETGSYLYRMSTVHGCDSIYRLELTVHPAGMAVIDTTLCRGERYQAHGFDVDREGTYTDYRQTLYGCDSTVILNLKMIDFFEGSIQAYTEDCRTHAYRFEAEGNPPEGSFVSSLRWDFGDGTGSEGWTSFHVYPDSGRYEVKLTAVTGGKCNRTFSFLCPVPYYTEEVAFYPDVEAVDAEYPEVVFRADSLEGMQYFWDFGDETTAEGKCTVTHRYKIEKKDFYEVRLQVVNREDCVAETRLRLEVCLFPEIPNTFSPNGDGINDVFMKGYRIEIRDRNGLKIYEGEDGWEGVYRGKQVKEDTYFYTLFYRTARGEKCKKGFVNVVR